MLILEFVVFVIGCMATGFGATLLIKRYWFLSGNVFDSTPLLFFVILLAPLLGHMTKSQSISFPELSSYVISVVAVLLLLYGSAIAYFNKCMSLQNFVWVVLFKKWDKKK